MKKFPKIGQLKAAAKWAREFLPEGERKVTYEGTVKLHGTNAGVHIDHDGAITCQSRNRVITPEDDNAGFAAWIHGSADILAWLSMQRLVDTTFYGEWCGGNIMQGTALNKLEKHWVLFAERISGIGALGDLWYGPPATSEAPDGVYSILQVQQHHKDVDFDLPRGADVTVKDIEDLTLAIDAECPWGKFRGVEGIGEGLVWRPIGEHQGITDLMFKSKGGSHRDNPNRRPKVLLDPERLANLTAFIDFAVTPERLQQGFEYLEEMGMARDRSSTGAYVQWVANDVKTECALELVANGMVWKDVGKRVGALAAQHFLGSV
jgi:hypothetical protein